MFYRLLFHMGNYMEPIFILVLKFIHLEIEISKEGAENLVSVNLFLNLSVSKRSAKPVLKLVQ